MRVLVANDDPLARHAVCAIVRTLGYTVLAAEDGLQAWDIIQNQEISLLITDWQMPGLDGPTLIRRVRAANFPHYISCFLLTVRDQRTDRISGLDAGADDYLVKPVDPDELRARIATSARVIRLEQELRAANTKLQELAAQLQHQATHDQLTGLLNRHGILAQAKLEKSRTERTGHPFGLALLDIDHFKLVNDQYGHAVGDLALKHIAIQLRSILRPYDLIARWGGEEFLLLMPNVSLDIAAIIAERVREQIGATPLSLSPIQFITLHVSIGVTSSSDGNDQLDELIALADQGLYTAKGAGRNQVCCIQNSHKLPVV